MRHRQQQLWQAACCLLWFFLIEHDLDQPGEFIGGWLTGALFHMADIAWALFALAFLLTFFYRRVAATVALFGCALYLPHFLYFTAPGPFRTVFGGEWSTPLQANFVWGFWQTERMLLLAVTTYVCTRGLTLSVFGVDRQNG